MSWVVSTDMDGTLLNHSDYRWEPAKPYLEFLHQVEIPVILNTSKTFAEVSEWVRKLGILHPFVVENGSAIYCPKGYFSMELLADFPQQVTQDGDYDVIRLGVAVQQLLDFKQHHAPTVESLVECTLDRAIEITGLTPEEAKAAQQRYYTLPLVLEDEHALKHLHSSAQEAQLQLLSGGRFAHLMGQCDKGRAIQYLCELYSQQTKQKPIIVALGDSGNDRAMLAIADHAILVRNHQNGWLEMNGDSIYKTSQQAPEGWVEGIVEVLSNDFQKLKELT